MGWLIVDGHQDIAMSLLEDPTRDFAAPAPAGRALSLADARRGGLAVILATIFAPQGHGGNGSPTETAEKQLRWYDELLHRHAEEVFRLESRGDLSLCAPGGPIGIVHLMEGADPIRSVRELSRWVDRGVRIVAPAWNTPNRWCGGVEDGSGLTADGVALVEEMGKLGVVPDLSHLTPAAFDSVLACHRGLVVASHSNAAAVHAHRRNLSDAQIRAIADRDGLVGIVLYRPFLGEGRVDLETVVRHVDHIVGLVGPDHVGLGSDLDGGFTTDDAPEGIRSVADLPRIGELLLQRGYNDDAVARILGRSWLRVLEQALPA
ncbi:MAG: dipeptidase [Planctomycetota bacterium]